MEAEIKKLKSRLAATKSNTPSWVTQAVEGLGHDFIKIVTAPVRFVDHLVTGILSLFKGN